MRTSKATWLFFSCLVLGACGDAARQNAPEKIEATVTPRDLGDIDAVPARLDPLPANEFLVWTREDDGCAETHRLDASGRELETIDGILIATSSGTWRWREQ